MQSAAKRKFKRAEVRKQKIISGTAGQFKSLKGDEPSRDVFIYRAHKDTTEDDLKEFAETEGFKVRNLTDVSDLEKWHTQSFILTVPISQLDKALNPDSWPQGICVRRHFPPKEKVVSHHKVE